MIPAHHALAPADPGYDALEVDPWPHIHVDPHRDGTVTVQLIRWKGQHAYDRYSRDELAGWAYEIDPPGRLARLLGQTIGTRIDDAIARLERQWAEQVAAADAAYMASMRIGRHE